MSRTHNTIRNSLWGMGQKILMLLAPFIIRTLIIKTLGAEYLGLNSLFVSVLQVLNLAELGFSSAITFSLYKPIAEKNVSVVCGLMCVYRKIYRYVGCGILVAGLLFMPFLSLVIKGDVPTDINIYILYVLYLFNTVISYLLFAYKTALLEASQRNDLVSRTHIYVQIAQYVLQIILLLALRNYYWYYIVTPIFTCLYNLRLSFIVDKMFPDYTPKGSISDGLKSDLKCRVKGVVISKFCAISRNALSSILISATLGLYSVAVYSNYFLVVTSLASFMTIVTTAMSASVGNSMVVETEEKNHQDFKKFTFLYAWIAGVCTCGLIASFQFFMTGWLGESMLLPFHMVVLLGLYFYVLTSGDVRSTYMNSKGLWWENRYRTIFESISNVALSLLFIKLWGLPGVLLGPIVSMIVFNFGMSSTILYKYCFPSHSCGYVRYWAEYLFYAMIAAVSIILAILCVRYLFDVVAIENAWLKFVLCGVISVGVANVVFICVFCKWRYYKSGKDFLFKVVQRR